MKPIHTRCDWCKLSRDCIPADKGYVCEDCIAKQHATIGQLLKENIDVPEKGLELCDAIVSACDEGRAVERELSEAKLAVITLNGRMKKALALLNAVRVCPQCRLSRHARVGDCQWCDDLSFLNENSEVKLSTEEG